MAAPSVHPAGTPIGDLLEKNYELPEGQPDGIAADAIDPVTGEYLSISEGFDPLDAFVLGQLSVVRASGSAVASDGRDFSDVQHSSARDESIFRQEILRPLEPVISTGEVKVSVDIQRDDDEDTMIGYVTYTIKATGAVRSRIPVPSGTPVSEAS